MKTKCFLICCLMAAAAMGQVSHVVPPGTAGVNPSSPFNSWETAATNIQEAVNAAAGQEWTNVWVSNGTYTLTGQVEIAAAMTVRSWHDGALDRAGTIVNGGNLAGNPTSNRCFYINHSNAVVEGITITNGWAYGAGLTSGQAGGGVYVNRGMLIDCTVIGCEAQYLGGGVMVQAAGVVRNCLINGNTSLVAGGGARVWGGILDNCDIVSNYAASTGGGISLSHAGIVTNTRVKSNYSVSTGGGVSGAATGGLLTHSEISANSNNSHGAGMFVEGALFTAEYCTVNGNISYFTGGSIGGGLYLRYGPVAEHCTVASNVAGYGGGLYLDNATCRYSDIAGNLGHGLGHNRGGGGLYINYTGLVENCRITDNVSTMAAGVMLWLGKDISLRNCLIAGNVTTGAYAGGVYVYQGTGNVFQNSTIVSNYAPNYGGGVYVGIPATTVVENCVMYFNENGLGGGYSNFYRGTSYLICNNSCIAPSMDPYGVHNTVDDPQFVAFAPDMDAGAWDFRLRADSPCVNTGTNLEWMAVAVDLDGHARLDRFTRRVDMGCYEYYSSGSLFLVK